MWIEDHSLLHTKLNGYYVKNFSEDTLAEEAITIAKSNFSKYSIFPSSGREFKCLTAFVAKANGRLNIIHNGINKTILVSQFDIIIKDSPDPYDAQDMSNFYVLTFAYVQQKALPGVGDKVFEVTAKISDEYRITVRANTSDEAIDFANGINISEWEHPDIEPHLTKRQIVRYARWGNLNAKEVS